MGSEIGGRGAVALARACAKVAGLKMVGLNGNAIPEENVGLIEELLGDRLGSLSDNEEDAEDEDEDSESDSDGEEETEVCKKTGDEEVDELVAQLGKVKIIGGTEGK